MLPLRRNFIAAVELDRKDLVDLCLDLGNMPDFHGKVRPLADGIAAWFKETGIQAYVQPSQASGLRIPIEIVY